MKVLSKISLEWLIFLLISLFIFWQYLLHPPFSMVDDGYSITLGRKLITDLSVSGWQKNLFEFDIGRFRPGYLLYFSMIYIIFGTEAIGLWFGQLLVLWFTLVLLFKIIKFFTKNRIISFIFTFIWLTFPSVAENIFRAGTAEPRQLLFILLTFYLVLVNKKFNFKEIFLTALTTILAIGTKETSIILLPLFFYVFIVKKYQELNKLLIFLFIVVILPILLFGAFITMKSFFQTGYAVENFSINLVFLLDSMGNVARTFTHYSVIILFVIASFFARVIISFFRKNFKKLINDSVTQFSLFILIIQSLFFVIAWKFHFERYFYLTWTFLLIFISIEFHKWTLLLKSKETILNKITSNQLFLFSCYILLVSMFFYKFLIKVNIMKLLLTPTQSVTIYKQSYDSTQISNSIISKLLANDSVEEVYLTNDGYEITYEVGLYASQFRERNIIVYGTNEELPKHKYNEGYRFVKDPVLAFNLSKNKNKILIGTQNEKNNFIKNDQNIKVNNIKPNVKYNIIDTKRHWWILNKGIND